MNNLPLQTTSFSRNRGTGFDAQRTSLLQAKSRRGQSGNVRYRATLTPERAQPERVGPTRSCGIRSSTRPSRCIAHNARPTSPPNVGRLECGLAPTDDHRAVFVDSDQDWRKLRLTVSTQGGQKGVVVCPHECPRLIRSDAHTAAPTRVRLSQSTEC
jgi:hypothetical protein